MNKAGEWGEIYANRYLREAGLEIITANYHCRFGEADIICRDKKVIAFVEVKARSANAIAKPREFVGDDKQRKLALTAAHFAQKNHIKAPLRFDVIEVYFPLADNYKVYKINYIKDAFRI